MAAEADLPLEELLDRRRALLAELRDVEHWRRLAEARLDLAVAAVTDIDELARRQTPCTRLAPYGLHLRVGIPDPGQALPETAALLRLRSVLEELETYAAALRRSCAEVTIQVRQRMDAEGYLEAIMAGPRSDAADHPGPRRAVTRRTRSARRTSPSAPQKITVRHPGPPGTP
ncbi:MAG TPA: hypothetical protein VFP72_01800 [Kineosporiaceae bacterium]|nr:hypothetical protein [Kineosporiaceae bacterium]